MAWDEALSHSPHDESGPPTDSAAALLDDLDEQQRAAVTTPSTLVAVIAGAGSGKTRVLIRRIAWRVHNETADARHTLALTFTREAAGELRRRLRALGLGTQITAGTFHAVMLAMLRQRATDEGRQPPNVVTSRHRLLGEIAGNRRIEPVLEEADWCAARAIRPSQYLSAAKRAGRHPGIALPTVQDLLIKYGDEKRHRGVIDINDVLLTALDQLERDSGFADAIRWRFRHVLVDEAQDLNPVQHRLVDALRAGADDLFLVGDPTQAIYGFNGADPALLVDVERRFPGVEIIRLPSNHRCTPQVVDVGAHVVARSQQPIEVASTRPDGPAVTQHTAADEDAEANLVAELIAGLDVAHVRTNDVAVLTRTRALLQAIGIAIERHGVPVRRRPDASGTPLAAVIGEASRLRSAHRLRAWAHDILDTPRASADRASDDPHETAQRQVAAAALDFLREQPTADGATFRSWLVTTDRFGQTVDGVELLTFHAAKGREWHTVVLAGVETGLVPHRSASTVAGRAEEARLLYVAATRATDRLVITAAQRRGGYARRLTPLLDGYVFGEPAPAPPPQHVLGDRSTSPQAMTRRLHDALLDWRRHAARRASIAPEQLCTDAQLLAISRTRPRTADELVDATGLGRLTAMGIIDGITQVLDDAR